MDFSKVTNLTIPEGVVTQIADAAGNVLWSATIKFTINGDTYIADRGMTWAEWFASSYNTTGETEGDIKDANGNEVSMDAVIVGGTAYEVGFTKLITFTIDGTAYQAEDGMTWAEWLDSSYNISGFYDSYGFVMKYGGTVVKLGTTNQMINMEIVGGAAYETGSNAPTPL